MGYIGKDILLDDEEGGCCREPDGRKQKELRSTPCSGRRRWRA